jgi:hypothetical protein
MEAIQLQINQPQGREGNQRSNGPNSPGCFLVVMMFVNVAVDRLDVQGPMHNGIEKVEGDKKGRQGKQDSLEREVVQAPQNIGFIETIA